MATPPPPPPPAAAPAADMDPSAPPRVQVEHTLEQLLQTLLEMGICQSAPPTASKPFTDVSFSQAPVTSRNPHSRPRSAA